MDMVSPILEPRVLMTGTNRVPQRGTEAAAALA
jgi:hypothetical protein